MAIEPIMQIRSGMQAHSRNLACAAQRAASLALLIGLGIALGSALSSCGGSNSAAGGTPGGGGGGGQATAFYLSGISDPGISPTLTGVNPNTWTVATIPTTVAGTNVWPSNPATVATEATITEWTANAGTATAVGIRYRVWQGSDGHLYNTDLADFSGSTTPTTAQLSTLSLTGVCANTTPLVLNDYAKPANSLLSFRAPGGVGLNCAASTDLFNYVPLSATATSPAAAASLNEPVDAVRDASGAITRLLFILHSPSSVSVGYAASTTATPTAISPALSGLGATYQNGDFLNLGVIPTTGSATGAGVWLFRDFNSLMAVDLAAATPAAVAVYGLADTDTIQGRAVIIDGTMAYVGITDAASTVKIVRIDGTAPTAGSGVEVITDASTGGLQLAGVAGNNLVYFINGNSVLKAVTKTMSVGVSANATTIYPPTAGNSIEPVPVIVGGGVYFTVDSQNGAPVMKAYFYDGTVALGASNPMAIGPAGNNSQVLGGVAASPVATANPGAPAYASALIALLTTGTGPLGSSDFGGATIAGYGSGGTLVTTYAPVLPVPQNQGDTYDGAVLAEGSLQMGMPALLTITGFNNQTGSAAADLFQFTPGTAASIHQVTNNIQ